MVFQPRATQLACPLPTVVTMRIIPLVAVFVPALALAQADITALQRPSRPMREAAQTHYRSGSQFFESKQFDAALVEFEAAWRLSGEPDRRVGTRRRAGLRRSVSEGLSPNPTCPFR